MPVPFLLAGLGVAAGVLGAGGHLSAKETNERAQRISQQAKELYDSSKAALEIKQKETEMALMNLGTAKKKTLDYSMKQFLVSYDKIKHVTLKDSIGLNEINNFSIDQQEALQLREMTDIYSSSIKSGATGAAAGAMMALAASGSLSVVGSELALAGTFLTAGEVGAAMGMAGSALSFGAAMTPLAAVAAPVVLFTGISASLKADENLEKAKTMYAEAEAASEKMKVSETICEGITERSEMFNSLLTDLDVMFSECTMLLQKMIANKEGKFFKKKITSESFSEDDLKLIAVTRALAGAVKAVIDTPILTNEGTVSDESKVVFENTAQSLPDFEKAVEDVKAIDFTRPNTYVDSSENRQETRKKVSEEYRPNLIFKFVMWILSISTIGLSLLLMLGGVELPALTWMVAGIVMCPMVNKKMKFFGRLFLMIVLMILGCFLL